MSIIDANTTHAVQPVVPAAPPQLQSATSPTDELIPSRNSIGLPLYRFTVAQDARFPEFGILDRKNVELLDGLIVRMMDREYTPSSLPPVLITNFDQSETGLPLYRFSLEEYLSLGAHGILLDDRTELLDGLILPMTPLGVGHCYCVDGLVILLRAAIGNGNWHVFGERPVVIGTSMPQPDVSVARGTRQDYVAKHPKPSDTSLVIEVSETTLSRDRSTKVFVYAASGISEFWIVNLVDRQIEVFRNPKPASEMEPATYAVHEIISEAGSVAVSLDGMNYGSIPVTEILP